MRGKRPTLKQKKFLSSKKLTPENWLVVKNTSTEVEFINRNSGKIRRFEK